MHGHLWTVLPVVRDRLRPPRPPAATRLEVAVDDAVLGQVRLNGWLAGGGSTVVVLVHGLGGSADSSYCVRFARAAAARGLATLRLNLRGADLAGGDFYHAGLSSDLAAVIASPALERFERVVAVGFSLGGHVLLRLAATEPGRLARVAALCAPLDLAATCHHIERPAQAVYRRYLLGGLKAMYRAVAATRPVPLDPADADRITSLYQWDERIVAPRHGFAGADDYYRRASVGPLLGELGRPTLYVGAARDPMVARATVAPALARPGPALTTLWRARGGHVGFPDEAAVQAAILDFLVGPGAAG